MQLKPDSKVLATVLSAMLTACGGPGPEANQAELRNDLAAGACTAGGFVEAEIYGGIRATLDWDEQLVCDGMPRPNGAGARLHFAGVTADDEQRPLSLILGLPDLQRGATGKELPTNVTLIAEDQGRFFSTPDTTNCWTDISSQERVGDDRDSYRISGILYCMAALAEVNGTTSVTLGDMNFAGILTWRVPE